ncbi:MAG TPA: hypothetical protein VGX68_05110 [Thermoanaerobaculia bacterium]|jgi:hypothetical protein|nr:hypothetical protein [Thermoanaerobaculia bacterium]
MKKMLQIIGRSAAVAALLMLAADAVQAQQWPTTNPLRCNWTLPNGSSGTATVTFGYTAYDPFFRDGILTTRYPSGASVAKHFRLYWDWWTGLDTRFIFDQTEPPNIECQLTRTAEYGTIVIFDGCSNGAFQYCRYP